MFIWFLKSYLCLECKRSLFCMLVLIRKLNSIGNAMKARAAIFISLSLYSVSIIRRTTLARWEKGKILLGYCFVCGRRRGR